MVPAAVSTDTDYCHLSTKLLSPGLSLWAFLTISNSQGNIHAERRAVHRASFCGWNRIPCRNNAFIWKKNPTKPKTKTTKQQINKAQHRVFLWIVLSDHWLMDYIKPELFSNVGSVTHFYFLWIFISQNHKTVDVGKDFRRLSCPTPAQAESCRAHHAQMYFELPGQVFLVLSHLQWKKVSVYTHCPSPCHW